MFRILFNCGLRTSELLKLRMCDVNLKENVFTILDTKFHKNRLVPFSDTVAESLTQYLEMSPPKSTDSLLFQVWTHAATAEDTGTVGCKLNFASSSERRVFLTMVQEKALGLMISATHLRYTVLTTGSFRVKILPLRYPYFHGILDIMDWPARKISSIDGANVPRYCCQIRSAIWWSHSPDGGVQWKHLTSPNFDAVPYTLSARPEKSEQQYNSFLPGYV